MILGTDTVTTPQFWPPLRATFDLELPVYSMCRQQVRETKLRQSAKMVGMCLTASMRIIGLIGSGYACEPSVDILPTSHDPKKSSHAHRYQGRSRRTALPRSWSSAGQRADNVSSGSRDSKQFRCTPGGSSTSSIYSPERASN